MEETATQPATQPHEGATRPFSVREQDKTDVICILHPASRPAYRAVELVVRQCPQHILQNEGLEYLLNDDNDESEPAGSTRPDLGSQGSQDDKEITEESMDEAGNHVNSSAKDEAGKPSRSSAKDIALRLSSRVRNICLGFTFGRSPLRCDIPIVSGDEKSLISNSHFRIYVRPNGVLMVEDTSRNGTWVDDIELRAKSSNPSIDNRRSIVQGSVISIPDGSNEAIRFLVGWPARYGHEVAYAKALEEYSAYIGEVERRAALAAQAEENGNMMPPPVRIHDSVTLGQLAKAE